MSKLTVGGVHFRTSGVLIVDKAGVKEQEAAAEFESVAAPPDCAYGEIAPWGKNNDLPATLADDMEACGMLNAGIDMKARIALGKGPMPAIIKNTTKDGLEELEFINDPEINDFLEANNDFEYHYATLKDLITTGNTCSQFVINKKRDKILTFKRNDVTECRLQKMDQITRKIPNVILSSDWKRYTSSRDSDYMATIPLLDRDFPLHDLQQRTTGFNFAIWGQYPLFRRKYYALSGWWPAYKWVKIAIAIPEMKEAMFNNEMTIKYQVIIHELFWDKHFPEFTKNKEKQQEIKEAFYDDIEEYLVGNKNAYKSMFTTRWLAGDGTPVEGIEIKVLDDKIKDGKLLPDSAGANSEIAFALQMNTAIAGVTMPGTGSNVSNGGGSNIREAYLVQVMLMESERRIVSRMLNIVKQYNNWLPGQRLVWRFPNQILTTLDKGKNTEGTV